jgi:hypothetical protein
VLASLYPAFMEAASEKLRRGRPPMMTPYQLARLRKAHPGRTTRQLQERVYAMLAADGLAGDPAYAWLLEPVPRVGLLAELGRFEDAATARSAASMLCRDRPSVKAGVAWLRRLRLGGDATVDGLAAALAAAADCYTARHGRLPSADEQRAVDRVGRALARTHPDLAAELGIEGPNG